MANCGIITGKKVSGSLGGIRSHMNREHESNTNPDIDPTRSPANYCIEQGAEHLQKRVNARIGELKLKKAPRKDAVKLVDFVVTASPDAMQAMSPHAQKAYFEHAVDFLKSVYGNQNFMYCTVHMDEKTPHAHIGFVPITKDGRLCAKEVMGRNALRALQDGFYKNVSSQFGLERGEVGQTDRKHIDTTRLKAETAEKKALAAKKNFLAAEAQEQKAVAYVNEVIKRMKLAKRDIDHLEEINDRARKKEKGIFSKEELFELTGEDFRSLQTMIKRAMQSTSAFFELQKKEQEWKKHANKLEQALADEKAKTEKLAKENTKLQTAYKEFSAIPKKFLESALEKWKAEKAKAKQSGSINQRPRSGSAPVHAPRRGGGR